MKRRLLVAGLLAAGIGLAFPPPVSAKRHPKPRGDLVHAFDSGAYIGDPSWFAARRAEGYELYIPHALNWGTRDPWPELARQFDAALAAGMGIAAYVRPVEYWQAGLDACRDYRTRLRFWTLDVEDAGHPITRDMVSGVQSLGVRPVIYTGWGMWGYVMGGSTEFRDVSLWDYSGPVEGWPASIGGPNGFGGWTSRVGQQLRWDVQRDGIGIDDDVFDRAWLEGNTP